MGNVKTNKKETDIKETGIKEATTQGKTLTEIALEDKILQLENMLKQFINNQNQIVPQVNNELNDNEIPFKKFIQVMSLTDNTLTLSTQGMGKGKLFNFVEFGQIQHILYEDLSDIIHNHPEFTKDGAYVILNQQVVKLHGLESYYSKILSKEKIENILTLDKNEIINLFNSTSEKIKEAIVSLITTKLLNNEFVDLNKLQIISDLYGRDINLMVKEVKNQLSS